MFGSQKGRAKAKDFKCSGSSRSTGTISFAHATGTISFAHATGTSSSAHATGTSTRQTRANFDEIFGNWKCLFNVKIPVGFVSLGTSV